MLEIGLRFIFGPFVSPVCPIYQQKTQFLRLQTTRKVHCMQLEEIKMKKNTSIIVKSIKCTSSRYECYNSNDLMHCTLAQALKRKKKTTNNTHVLMNR